MATPNTRDIRKVPGRLCLAPLDLSKPFPHDGTPLGLLRAQAFRLNPATGRIGAGEYGGGRAGHTVDGVFGGFDPLFVGVLRTAMDFDMLDRVFFQAREAKTGDVMGAVAYDVDGDATRAGRLLSEKSGVVLFSALSSRDPSLILYNALPANQDAAEVQLAKRFEWGLAVAFWAAPDATKRVWDQGPLEDLTL